MYRYPLVRDGSVLNYMYLTEKIKESVCPLFKDAFILLQIIFLSSKLL